MPIIAPYVPPSPVTPPFPPANSPIVPVPDWAAYGQRPTPLGYGAYAGIPWGPLGSGLPIMIQPGWQGFDETPDLVTNDQQKSSGDGTYSSRAYTGPRTLTLPFLVVAPSAADLQQVLATLEMAWDPDGKTWGRLWAFNGSRFVNAQVRNRAFVQNLAGHGQISATGIVQFFAKDPYWYGPDQAFTLSSRVMSGGMQFPMPFPMEFGTTSPGGGLIYNPGLRAPLRIHIPGPMDHPFVGSDTQGVGLDLGITLRVGDSLDIDSGVRSIVLNGSVPRNDLLTGASAFFDVLHGNNQFRFRSHSEVLTERANGAWNSRWR